MLLWDRSGPSLHHNYPPVLLNTEDTSLMTTAPTISPETLPQTYRDLPPSFSVACRHVFVQPFGEQTDPSDSDSSVRSTCCRSPAPIFLCFPALLSRLALFPGQRCGLFGPGCAWLPLDLSWNHCCSSDDVPGKQGGCGFFILSCRFKYLLLSTSAGTVKRCVFKKSI